MRTTNGGEEQSWGSNPHPEGYPIQKLAAQANAIFRVWAATTHIGQLVLPAEIPRPPDQSLN